MRSTLAVCLLMLPAACATVPQPSPQAAVDQLLAADRAFSAASAKTDLPSGLAAMFDPNVVMPLPNASFARSAAEATDAIKANSANLTSRIEWSPIRGGVSADGTHGFTTGYILTTRANGEEVPGKYMAYWVKRPQGWRVAVYKRAPREATGGLTPQLPASLPSTLSPATPGAEKAAQHKASLIAAEKAFSDDAQVIGVGPAFAKNGRADASNFGGPQPAFVVGAEAISKGVGGGPPSTIEWSAEDALVSPAGDLGVTWGFIRLKSGERPPSPFFTIWRRDSETAPWRYLAE